MTLRKRLIRLAARQPENSPERRALVALLGEKQAGMKYRDKRSLMNAIYNLTDEVTEINWSLNALTGAGGRPKAVKDLKKAVRAYEDYAKAAVAQL
jgi:hypothetical protein